MKIATGRGLAMVAAVIFAAYLLSKMRNSDFINRVQSEIELGSKELNLSKLMPGTWELVCDSSGYGGPVYLKQYNRTYEPVGEMQDGAWGLIFIQKDGTFVSETGSRRHGFTFDFGCIEKSKARLTLKNSAELVWVNERTGS